MEADTHHQLRPPRPRKIERLRSAESRSRVQPAARGQPSVRKETFVSPPRRPHRPRCTKRHSPHSRRPAQTPASFPPSRSPPAAHPAPGGVPPDDSPSEIPVTATPCPHPPPAPQPPRPPNGTPPIQFRESAPSPPVPPSISRQADPCGTHRPRRLFRARRARIDQQPRQGS